eukprot:scaffold1404_cov166-Amphora_coffeaeformis.AAC.9
MKIKPSYLSPILLLSPGQGFFLSTVPTVRGCQRADFLTTTTTSGQDISLLSTTALPGATSTNEEEDEISRAMNPSNLSWLHEAMGNTLIPEPDGLVLPDITTPGISGFAVDHKRGFVVILTCTTTTTTTANTDRATYAIVSPRDKTTVKSPEALTLVQLSGGLDLGTSVLPPDCLITLVAQEMQRTSDDTNTRTLLPSQVQLQRVKVIPNPDYQDSDTKDTAPTSATVSSTPARNASIQSQAPQVWKAVNKLHGIQGEATMEQVEKALQNHADTEGKVDRVAFSALLETLRDQIHATEPSPVKFVLEVSISNAGQQQMMEIPAPTTVVAVGLALRYKVDMVVPTEAVQHGGLDVMEIPTQFPASRPIQQLYEDAKLMDGFIPSMFTKATAPRNDDKKM